jgi:DNA-binding winged helix-turn-helix (wHTH) protein
VAAADGLGSWVREREHYLHVYVRQLRQKLGDEAAMPRYIVTEPGVGYRWGPDPDRNADQTSSSSTSGTSAGQEMP